MSRIKEHRTQAGINQKTIADRLGLSISQYSRIERAPENANLGQLRTIATVLGVPLADILDDGSNTVLSDGLTVTRLYLSLPVLETSEVRNLGALKKNDDREYLAPAQNLSTDCFWTIVKGNENSPSLESGDRACWSPSANIAPGDIVIASDDQTTEVVIGRYYPLHPTNPDAPGFVIKPIAAPHGEARFSKGHPGQVHGRLMERRQMF